MVVDRVAIGVGVGGGDWMASRRRTGTGSVVIGSVSIQSVVAVLDIGTNDGVRLIGFR